MSGAITSSVCRNCGASFEHSLWRKRSFCSRQCHGELRRKAAKAPARRSNRYRSIQVGPGKQGMEHRYVMEAIIGRPLTDRETVHHVNGDPRDNRPSNLELWHSSHCSGQRVRDLISYVVKYHREDVEAALSHQKDSPVKMPVSLSDENWRSVLGIKEPGDPPLLPHHSRMVTAFGETKPVRAWARDRRCSVTHACIKNRLDSGMAPEEAISKPRHKNYRWVKRKKLNSA